jgi:hypothetical protein
VFIFVADLVVDAWLGWHFQVFFTTGPTPGLLQDTSALITDFVVNPLLCGIFLWTSCWAAEFFRRLSQAHVFENGALIKDSEARRQTLYRSRQAFTLAFILALIGTMSQVGSYKGWFPWRTIEGYLYLHNGDMSFFRAPFWFITLYGTLYIVFNTAVTVYLTYQLFNRQRVRLQLLHPDGCGGLGSLAEYASTGAILIVPLGALISTSIITATLHKTLAVAYPVWIMLSAYIILAPVLLVLPLYTAHKAMKRAKYAELHKIAEVYNQEYGQIAQMIWGAKRSELGPGEEQWQEKNVAKRKEKVRPERLEQIKQLYQTVENDFPTWPLNVRIIGRYVAIVVSPLLPAFLAIAIDTGSKIIQGILP